MRSTKPRYFADPHAFRAWLQEHHGDATELLVGFCKRDTGLPSMTWPASVDQALCFGWIDGVRKRIDDERYSIRFTPRRPSSTWSTVNIRRVAALEAEGLMQPAGLDAFARRSEERSRIYAYEQRHTAALADEDLKKLQANRKAWAFFAAQPAGYRQVITYWIVSGKKAETRQKRLDALIEASAAGRRVER
jgi:uncharacterized protein YdeI (YjbR/CyaY-like superfamily)